MNINQIFFICLLAILSACTKTKEEKPPIPEEPPVEASMPSFSCQSTFKGVKIVPSQRMALVIGNDNYRKAPLKNPGNDADDIATALKQVNFEVTKEKNLSLNEMRCLIQEFGKTLSNYGGVGLFYFSGHGMQYSGKNYLLPIGATSSVHVPNDLPKNTINLDDVLNTMKMARNDLNILILDACRDLPLPLVKTKGLKVEGLAEVSTTMSSSLIAYATEHNHVALDGNGRNSPYVKHLKRELVKPNVRIEEMFRRVRVAVKKETRGKQRPLLEHIALDDPFCFNGCEQIQSRNDDKIQQPMMKPVERGTYNIPLYLQDWIKDVSEPVIINKRFYIMTREVTVGDFRQYKYIEGQDEQPLRSISWQEARDYANWLSNQTGKNFKLPSYSQWVAAAVKYAKPEHAITRETVSGQIEPKQRVARPTKVHDLLANLREWTTTSCENNQYYVVGKDYKTWQQSPKNKLCGDQGYSNVIGFRLILEQ